VLSLIGGGTLSYRVHKSNLEKAQQRSTRSVAFMRATVQFTGCGYMVLWKQIMYKNGAAIDLRGYNFIALKLTKTLVSE
jgi:hypothetical protein